MQCAQLAFVVIFNKLTANVFVRCTLNTLNPVYNPTILTKLASRKGVAGEVILDKMHEVLSRNS